MKIILWSLILLFLGCTEKKVNNIASNEANLEHENQHKKELFYTCSMHPQIKQDHPGKCPICGMGLTKIEQDLEGEPSRSVEKKKIYYCKSDPSVTSEAPGECPLDGTPLLEKKEDLAIIGKVKLRKAQFVHFKPDLFSVTTMKMKKEVRLLGTVMKSEERESNIPAQVPGRVEEVFIQSAGSFIKKGDPVLKLYSPKLLAGGEEYLVARKNVMNNKKNRDFLDLLKQSRERLKLWGIQDKQIQAWEKEDKIPREVTIYSEATGIVENKNAVIGKYFKEGQSFFDLVDLSTLWVELDVYEHDSALVKIGQKVKLEFIAYPGEVWEGEVNFINPILDEKNRTLKIRTTLDNSLGKLRPGMVGDATLVLEKEGEPLIIPRNAVIDTGLRKVVWVKKEINLYQAQLVKTGFESQGYVEVTAGLSENDEVVIEGNFLLDAQAQLFGGYSGVIDE